MLLRLLTWFSRCNFHFEKSGMAKMWPKSRVCALRAIIATEEYVPGTGGPGQRQLLPFYVESKSQSKMTLFPREEVIFFNFKSSKNFMLSCYLNSERIILPPFEIKSFCSGICSRHIRGAAQNRASRVGSNNLNLGQLLLWEHKLVILATFWPCHIFWNENYIH